MSDTHTYECEHLRSLTGRCNCGVTPAPSMTDLPDAELEKQRDEQAYIANARLDALNAARAELDSLRNQVTAWEEAGYDLWRPYGDDCEMCGTKWEASIVRPTVILDGSLTPVRGSDDE